MRNRYLAIVIVAVVGSLITAAAAEAETKVVGPSLPGVPIGEGGGAFHCPLGPGCALMTLVVPNTGTAAVSPIDGTVTRWRVQGASGVAGYSLNVMRRNSDGSFTVTASSAPVTPAGSGVETFAAALPIKAGEYIELTMPRGGAVPFILGEGESTIGEFAPPPVLGSTANLTGEQSYGASLAVNADVQPPALAPAPIKEIVTLEVPPKNLTPAPKKPTSKGSASANAESHCVVPKLVGRKPAVAKRMLRQGGCKVGVVARAHGVKAAKARVKRSAPKAGRELPPGTPVSLKLG